MRIARREHSALAVLGNADYRHLLTGTVLWWQCFFMEMVVLGWLVFDISNSARVVALVGFARTLPLLLVSLFSGAIIDYFGRRRVVIAAQSVNLASYLLLIVLLAIGRATPWNIGLVVFVLGAAWALDWPTRRSLVPDLLGKERMVDGLLVESMITGLARIVAPSIAGALIARYGALGCYVAMALLAACSLAALLPLLRGAGPLGTRARMATLPLAGDGMRYVRANPTILAVILITLIINLWIFPYVSLLPVFTRDILGKGPIELGFLSTGTGMGAFVGLLLINALRRRVYVGTLFAAGTAWMCIALGVFALSRSYPLSWAMLFCAGMGMACFATLQSTIILLVTSDEMRSRVMGIVVLAIGGDPLGQLQIGTLAERFGVQATLAGQACAALLVIALIVLRLPNILRPAERGG